jgi:hypothetical protein
MTALIIETTAGEQPPFELSNSGAELTYFLSFAVAERYGAQHELAEASGILKRQSRINLGPLLQFGDAHVENEEEREDLEKLWQDPKRVGEAARQVVDAVAKSAKLQTLLAEFPDLVVQLEELAEIADWADEKGAKLRLTYAL